MHVFACFEYAPTRPLRKKAREWSRSRPQACCVEGNATSKKNRAEPQSERARDRAREKVVITSLPMTASDTWTRMHDRTH
eukprot:6187920-Pleurochrysis_carterae.AAC.3